MSLFKTNGGRFAKELAAIREETKVNAMRILSPEVMVRDGLAMPPRWMTALYSSPEHKAMTHAERRQLDWMDYATGDQLYEFMRRRCATLPRPHGNRILATCEWVRGEPADLHFTVRDCFRKNVDIAMAAYMRGETLCC
ncbi:hypothetical protein [Erwinia sp. S59]|uniref:hypothetical protein n=1 Tax=Erwinia sp. S59 TaxID=2769340 RepID=UPI00190DD2B4|nr:hypothetical protein [Erwinia sp. S59]MBK0092811.1 hypothetical protein [Erwinia sp. S59]